MNNILFFSFFFMTNKTSFSDYDTIKKMIILGMRCKKQINRKYNNILHYIYNFLILYN